MTMMTTFHYYDFLGLDDISNASRHVRKFVRVRIFAPHCFGRRINVDGAGAVVHHVQSIILMNIIVVVVDPNTDLPKKQ